MDKITDELNIMSERIATGNDAADMLTEMIWGAAATTTRAFGKVTLKVDSNNNRIYVAVKLRWWARAERFKLLHDAWIANAERRCLKQVPTGWKLTVYYDRSRDD